jgi:hypothetical protein
MKAYMYLGVEDNQNIEHKNKKEEVKEYVERIRLIFNTRANCKK